MRVYKCEFRSVAHFGDSVRLRVKMLEPHAHVDNKYVITSNLRSIDFERGIAVSQNSIYVWKVG